MTIQIKIDTKALEALFSDPDTKLQLQQSVIEEFTRRHIKQAFNAVESTVQIEKAVEETRREALDAFMTRAPGSLSNNWKLRPEYSTLIKNKTKELIEATVNETILEHTKQLEVYIKQQVETQVKYEINKVSSKMITEKVQKKMTSVLEMLDNVSKIA